MVKTLHFCSVIPALFLPSGSGTFTQWETAVLPMYLLESTLRNGMLREHNSFCEQGWRILYINSACFKLFSYGYQNSVIIFLLTVIFSAFSFSTVKLINDYMRKEIAILEKAAEINLFFLFVLFYFKLLFGLWCVADYSLHCLPFPYSIFLMLIVCLRT